MEKYITKKNQSIIKKIFERALDIGLKFKLQDKVTQRHLTFEEGKKLVEDFPYAAQDIKSLLDEFEEKILPYCINYSNQNFMGFPDAGNSVAALSGAILKEFLQQDLVNQSFCGPSATFVEIAVIKWLIEVETDNYRYNLKSLEEAIKKNLDKILAIVAYAGDSRTMTVDNFDEIHNIVRSYNEKIWLHADACHGFSLGFSEKLKYKLKGIDKFDSITMDPHKVMLIPYTLSVLVVKDPKQMKKISINSNLIINDDFDLGQITPFLGTKQWESLKLWFMMKNLGKKGLDELITKRHELAKYLEGKLLRDDDFIVINSVGINSVVFLYRRSIDINNIFALNDVSKKIYQHILEEGFYHLHQFPLPDSGKIKKGEIIYPLRFMCGNPNTSRQDIDQMIEYVRNVGQTLTLN